MASTAIYGYANKTPSYDAPPGKESGRDDRDQDAPNKERPSPPPFSVSSCDMGRSEAKEDVPAAPVVPAVHLPVTDKKSKVAVRASGNRRSLCISHL